MLLPRDVRQCAVCRRYVKWEEPVVLSPARPFNTGLDAPINSEPIGIEPDGVQNALASEEEMSGADISRAIRAPVIRVFRALVVRSTASMVAPS